MTARSLTDRLGGLAFGGDCNPLVGEWGVGYLELDHDIAPGSAPAPTPSRPQARDCSVTTGRTSTGSTASWTAIPTWWWRTAPRRHALGLRTAVPAATAIHQRPAEPPVPRPHRGLRAHRRHLGQGAVWAYPQPEDSPDEVAFTMADALLGHIHLSGLLPDLPPEARALVHEAVTVYKAIRTDLAQAVPEYLSSSSSGSRIAVLPPSIPGSAARSSPNCPALAAGPAGLGRPVARAGAPHPGHHLSHGLAPARCGDHHDPLTVPSARPCGPRRRALPPAASQGLASWHPDTADLTLTLPAAPSAVLLRLAHAASDIP